MNKELDNNSRVSHYRIVSKIGKGGMGEVYLAEDTKLNRQVALKILPAEFAEDKDRMSRFVREAQSASALNHPNIITIYEINEIDDLHYIATEFIKGKTLNDYVSAKTLKFSGMLDIAIQVASALDEAHAAGIVHRDIKPDNVMIRENGLVKILDFGIAKLTENESPKVDSEDATAIQQPSTSPGMIIGTANYMSPEQAKGESVDARTDIFSFGVLLYEMVAGNLPFEGETPMEIISSILKDEPKPLGEDIPPEIERIISKALRKNADERYQTIKGLLADLKEVKLDLDVQEKLEKTVQPNEDEQKTQMLKATTVDEQKQTTTANDSISINKAKFSKFLVGGLAVLLISFVGLGVWYLSGNSSDRIDSIAVMPFSSTDGNKDSEYLSDGLAESIIYDLSKIPQLKVLPASTVFRYKGKEINAETVADELGVRAVLVSRLSQNGDELTISTELIDTEQNKVIWGERYARKVNDSLAIQKEISREIAGRLQIGLSGEQEKNLARKETVNPEAYQAYLRGRFYWNKREDGLEKGIEYFNKAIELDPNYALAWSGLADSYFLSTSYLNKNEDEQFPKAKAAAEKAIELDPDLAEAHTSLASVLDKYDRDYKGAEREYLKAIELDPKYPTARHWYSRFLFYHQIGRAEEALKQAKLATELDPLSMPILASYAAMLDFSKKYEESLRQYRKVQEMFPEVSFFYQDVAFVLTDMERYDEALGECRKLEELDKNRFRYCTARVFYKQDKYRESLSECEKMEHKEEYLYQTCVAYAYAKLGEKQKVYEIINSDKFDYPMEAVALYGSLGENDKAYEVLEKLLAEKSTSLFDLHYSDKLEQIKADPRYDKLIKDIEANIMGKN